MAQFSVPGLGWANTPAFQLGRGKTLAIPMELHASARHKICDILARRGTSNGIVLLKGGQEQNQYDTDIELVFRQDSWFNYLFGAKEPELFGAISISTGKSTLFVPRLPVEYSIWCGKIFPPEYFKEMYGVDDVKFTDDLVNYLKETLTSEGLDSKIHVMEGLNTDSGLMAKPATFEGDGEFSEQLDKSILFHALATARVTKSDHEIEAMQYSSLVASNAHVEVMRSAAVGMVEYELEARFLYEIYSKGGCRKAAYTSICACGPNGAVLHYGHAGAPNDRTLEAGDIALLDMGADYHGYVSDITCSFPLSGTFTADQRAIYQGVLDAQIAVLALMRPGTAWPDCHRAAELAIVTALLGVGVLVGGTAEELQSKGLGAIFFPHGLGHLIGCDTHDVGGYLEGTPERLLEPGLRKLRTARVLEAGMVLTNEPGCYFIDTLLDSALANPDQAPHLDPTVLARFRGTGGVRLEDVVLVTAEGPANLTTCPRTIEEVEAVLAGSDWPPAKDDAPFLYRRWSKLAAGRLLQFML